MPKKSAPRPPGSKPKPQDPGFKPFAGLKGLRESLPEEPGKQQPGKQPPARRPAAAPVPDPSDAEERMSMHRMMSGVKPLDGRPLRIPRSQTAVAPSSHAADVERAEQVATAEAEAVHAHLRELVDGGASRRFEVTDDGRRVEGRRTELRTEDLRKLRHGLFPIDARIDLHGMGLEQAREALARFLADQRARAERCVLVIHGKGEHSPRGVGVLRGEIAAWLSQGTSSTYVAAFATAEAGDGGEGAVYVLLTR